MSTTDPPAGGELGGAKLTQMEICDNLPAAKQVRENLWTKKICGNLWKSVLICG